MRDNLTKVCVLQNTVSLLGLKFTYANGTTEEFSGTNDDSKVFGAVKSTEITLGPDEIIVGITVE